ncbi:hypothetical protein AAF463_20830 (plasmid) [Pantoea sp. BJ2]|uniref:Uncharacterized protein n=1 Tax=Pantoea sp. BJ2 TaxID=3141322 RepID=A0AAU7U2Y4_9GAMM
MIGFAAGSYGSKNEEDEHYRGYFGGIGAGYKFDKHSSVNLLIFIMDNNTYLDDPDKRFLISYTWQFQQYALMAALRMDLPSDNVRLWRQK